MTENTKFQDPDRDIDSKPLALRARGFQTLKLALRARYREKPEITRFTKPPLDSRIKPEMTRNGQK